MTRARRGSRGFRIRMRPIRRWVEGVADTMNDETTRSGAAGDGASQSTGVPESADDVPGGDSNASGSIASASLSGRPELASVADLLHQAVLGVQAGVDQLLTRFDEKLLHDEARIEEIKRLNAELVRHQPDTQWNTARPFVDQMVRHLDEVNRFIRRYEAEGDVSAKDIVEALEWLHENIELALEEHNITAFRPRAGEDAFDGRRHTVVGNAIVTTDAALERLIERCVRPGFERDGQVVARAAVKIYRHTETS